MMRTVTNEAGNERTAGNVMNFRQRLGNGLIRDETLSESKYAARPVTAPQMSANSIMFEGMYRPKSKNA